MTLSNYMSFCILVFCMVYSPGPMTMFLMANGMKKENFSVWAILLGANNAYLFSIIIFTAGLTQLLEKNILLLKMIQIGGIFYLLYLAYIQWNKKLDLKDETLTADSLKSTSFLYKKGMLITLTNPKTILLFSIIFPQFIEGDQYRLLQIAILGTTFLVLQFSSGWVYAYFGSRIRNLIDNPFHHTLINKLPAVVLLIVAGLLFKNIHLTL